MARHRYVVTAVGLLVSAVFIYLAVRGLDLAAIEDAFSHSELLPWLPIGVASYLLSHVARGVRCRLLVRRHAAIGLTTATHVVVVGYAANNVLPARLGELVRSGMLAERAAMPLAQSIAVTFIERVLDGLTLLFLLVVATLTVDVAGWMRELVYVALAVFGAAAIAMLVAARWPRVLVALAAGLGRPLGPKWRDRFAGLATSVTDAGACLRDPLDAALLGCSSLVVWCFEAGMYVALLPIFGIEVTWQLAVATMCVTGFGLLLPSSPGSIGPYHYFASQAMIVFGVAAPTALAYATLVHLAFYIPVTIWGAAAMAWYGVELNAPASGAPPNA
ncbi:MAG TPA: lysylphosphatidylglycerol synthase transmembrane domain-containing protein [Kofleriaceae bacterium]|nr:lysylphosphatidylglycerol synthase transmembrane domain-containing protein [Kofleriaceae bacterium]